MAKKIFKEKQHFLSRQAMWLVAAVGLIILGIGVRQFLHPSFSFQNGGWLPVAFALAVSVLLFWLAFRFRLKTAVTEKGITYKMSPLHARKHRIKWEELASYSIVETPRLAAHDGTEGFWLADKFTFSGWNGVLLKTCGGKRIFIGSHRLQEMQKAIEKAVGGRMGCAA